MKRKWNEETSEILILIKIVITISICRKVLARS